jgi:ribulose-5-phosphate 4-epimerase/fuculose-1-phosphate aldolase
MPTDELLATLIKAWRFLYRRGFIEGFGHISARVPGTDQWLLTRHSLGPEAHPEDFLLHDLDGRRIAGRGDMPGEFPIHLEILKARPDVGSVIHYHGMYSTAFTTAATPAGPRALQPIHLMGTLFHDGIPTYPDPRLVSNAERGVALTRALGSHRAVLLRAHGAAITGGSVEEAVAGAFLFEENAQRAVISAQLGEPQWLEPELAADAGAELVRSRGPFRRVWALVEADAAEPASPAAK